MKKMPLGRDHSSVRYFKIPNHRREARFCQEDLSPFQSSIKIIGSFSVDENRQMHFDNRSLLFLDEKYEYTEDIIAQNVDLTKSKFTDYDGTGEEVFHHLLSFVKKKFDTSRNNNKERFPYDFICQKGILSQFMSTYLKGSHFKMLVRKFGGTLYLTDFSYFKKPQALYLNEISEASYMNHTFQHIITGGSETDNVNANSSFRAVYAATIGPFNVLYSSEINCLDKEVYANHDEAIVPSAVVSIKTTTYGKDLSFTRINGSWSRNMLNGCPKLLLGYKDGCKLRMMRWMKVDDLYNKLKCLGMKPEFYFFLLKEILNFIAQKVEHNQMTYILEKKEGEFYITCEKCKEGHVDEEKCFPKWYFASTEGATSA